MDDGSGPPAKRRAIGGAFSRSVYNDYSLKLSTTYLGERDIPQAVEHSAVAVWILLHGRYICTSGYFPFQPMVHNWSINGCGMCCPCLSLGKCI